MTFQRCVNCGNLDKKSSLIKVSKTEYAHMQKATDKKLYCVIPKQKQKPIKEKIVINNTIGFFSRLN